MCCNDPQAGNHCACGTYRDACITTSQIVVIIAFFFAFGWWVNWVLALTALIILQVTWCCTMSRCGIITAGVCAAIVGGSLSLQSIIYASNGKDYYCSEEFQDFESDDFYANNDDALGGRSRYTLCNLYDRTLLIWVIGAGLWITVAVTAFIFACSGRMNRSVERFKANQGISSGVEMPNINATTAVPVASTPIQQHVMIQPTPGVAPSAGIAYGNPSSIKPPVSNEPIAVAAIHHDTDDEIITYLPDGSHKV